MLGNTYLAERDMGVRLRDNHREVEGKQLQRLARGTNGSVLGSLLDAFRTGLSESAELARETASTVRAWFARPQQACS